jgi:hypothetical protein
MTRAIDDTVMMADAPVVGLAALGSTPGVDEQRHQGGRQHAADDQLVDDVGRVVGDAVGVGQAGAAQRIGHGAPAQHPGRPRQHRAERRVGGRPHQVALAGRDHLRVLLDRHPAEGGEALVPFDRPGRRRRHRR